MFTKMLYHHKNRVAIQFTLVFFFIVYCYTSSNAEFQVFKPLRDDKSIRENSSEFALSTFTDTLEKLTNFKVLEEAGSNIFASLFDSTSNLLEPDANGITTKISKHQKSKNVTTDNKYTFSLWDPPFAPDSVFHKLKRSYSVNEMGENTPKVPLFPGRDSILSGLLTSSHLSLSDTKRNVIVAYRDFYPFQIVDAVIQRASFLKLLWDSLKQNNHFRSIYLRNLGMELMEVPEKLSLHEFTQLLLKHPSFVSNVFRDGETEVPRDVVYNDIPSRYSSPFIKNSLSSMFNQNGYSSKESSDAWDHSVANSSLQAMDEEFFLPKGSDHFDESLPFRSLKSFSEPNDENFYKQWAFRDTGEMKWGVDIQPAWHIFSKKTEKRKKFIIALIDSGIDFSHPDLKNNIWTNQDEICDNGVDDDNNGLIDDCFGWDFVNGDNNPLDDNGHGTASAGILAAQSNNKIGVAGMCWDCELMVLKALNSNIKGSVSGFVRAIDYAIGKGAKISNNSYGGRGSSFSGLQEAVKRARQQGMIFVAAAGNYQDNNDNDKNPVYPASYNLDNVISVTAITREGPLAYFSSYGKTTVDIAAPGEEIFSTFIGSTYKYVDGTSFAVPFVTGAAALIWYNNPEFSYLEVISRIVEYQKPSSFLKDLTRKSGTLNVWAALTKNGKLVPESESESITRSSCANYNRCHSQASCFETNNGPSCKCNQGFSGDGYLCVDINECIYNPCGLVSLCYNNVGSFECRCNTGFRRVGDLCEDLNECNSAASCPADATCYNFAGSYDCFCQPGYYWNSNNEKGGRCLPLPNSSSSACSGNGGCGLNSFCTTKRTLFFYSTECECLSGYVRHPGTQECIPIKLLDLQTHEYLAAATKSRADYYSSTTSTATIATKAPPSSMDFTLCFLGVCI